MKSSILNYFAAFIVVTVVIGLIYATVQQSYRTAADDPQIQMAEDLSTELGAGKLAADIYPEDTIDIAHSLSPVVIFYDNSGRPIRSTGYLDGKMCQLPSGVFDHARKMGMHMVTWQPRHDVRMAVVLIHVNSGPVEFVAAARSLREVEIREANLTKMVFMGWGVCVILIAITAGAQNRRQAKSIVL